MILCLWNNDIVCMKKIPLAVIGLVFLVVVTYLFILQPRQVVGTSMKPTIKGNGFLSNEQEETVPENEYFILGDNRYHSTDSRQSGFVKKGDIVGKLTVCMLNCK